MAATRVVLELEIGSDPPRGWIEQDGGRRRSFEGWLDLTRLLVEAAGGGGGRQSRPAAHGGGPGPSR